MPKPLTTKPPTSSVTRLLDLSSAARAVAPASEPPAQHQGAAATPLEPRPPAATLPDDHPCVKRELVLTPAADQAFTRLVDSYRRGTGTKLTASHVARAVLAAIGHAMPELEDEAAAIGIQKLPSNARASAPERARFEAMLADAFLQGLRRHLLGE
jgi:hypothetical protein